MHWTPHCMCLHTWACVCTGVDVYTCVCDDPQYKMDNLYSNIRISVITIILLY